uniref:LITAF domain-containing protein n=1 Tax=Lates calcarifer TaxID=8187 RepID=A0A4W6C4F6_LATCA
NHLIFSSLLEAKSSSNQRIEPGPSALGSNIFYVDAPPTIPGESLIIFKVITTTLVFLLSTAPTVILDVDKLPPCPCRTQCPECRQFIVTETFTSVSSVTWLVCIMTALIGCVAGCCLIPFCLDRFKSTTHRCPKCRSSIKTIKKL